MEALFVSSLRAIRSVFARGMFKVFLWSVSLTIFALITFVITANAFFQWLAVYLENDYWWSFLFSWVGGLGSGLLAWFFFPTIMPVIINFFDEHIARIIEHEDYPQIIASNPTPFWKELRHDLRFTLTAISLNILILPVYLFLPVIPFYLLNGYLLGHEFFIMAAKRHIPVKDVKAMRKRYGRSIMVAGILLTILATIPLINLLAPFWGVAVMVHLYHQLEKPAGTTLLDNGQPTDI